MKYKTRQLRNLSFRQIVKRKNKKTRKTNANVTSYLNKRIMHKNRRHTIRFVKKYKKKTRKIQSGGLGVMEGLLVGGLIAGLIFVALILWCASPENKGCFGAMEVLTLFAGGASRPYYRKRGNILNKYLVSMTSLFKRREALSMERSIHSLLQKKNVQYDNLFKSNTKLYKMFTLDQTNLLKDILKPQPYEDFKSSIAMFAQQLNGDLTPELKKFLSTNIIFSTAIKNNNRVVARTLMKDIVGNGETESPISTMISEINPSDLSIEPLSELLTTINNNPDVIRKVLGNEVISDKPPDTDTYTDTVNKLYEVAGEISDNLDSESQKLSELASQISPEEEPGITEKLQERNNSIIINAVSAANSAANSANPKDLLNT